MDGGDAAGTRRTCDDGMGTCLHQAAPVSRPRLVRLVASRAGDWFPLPRHEPREPRRGDRSAERGWTQLPISGHSCEHIRFAVGDEACLMSRLD